MDTDLAFAQGFYSRACYEDYFWGCTRQHEMSRIDQAGGVSLQNQYPDPEKVKSSKPSWRTSFKPIGFVQCGSGWLCNEIRSSRRQSKRERLRKALSLPSRSWPNGWSVHNEVRLSCLLFTIQATFCVKIQVKWPFCLPVREEISPERLFSLPKVRISPHLRKMRTGMECCVNCCETPDK